MVVNLEAVSSLGNGGSQAFPCGAVLVVNLFPCGAVVVVNL